MSSPVTRFFYRAFYRVLRLVLQAVLTCAYRIRTRAQGQIPREGAALLVANHVSLIDALLIGVSCDRPMRFVMDHRIYGTPGLSWLFKAIRVIPIAPAKVAPGVMEAAFCAIDEALAAGELVCLFPEGRLCRDGHLDEFRPGVERILAERPVPVVPLALGGLWGSRFSYRNGLLRGRWRASRRRVDIAIGRSIEAGCATARHLESVVQGLKAPLAS